MEAYLSGALVLVIIYCLMLRKQVSTLRKSVNLLEDIEKGLVAALNSYENKLTANEEALSKYLVSTRKKANVDKSKTGEDLIEETNDLLTGDLFGDTTDTPILSNN